MTRILGGRGQYPNALQREVLDSRTDKTRGGRWNPIWLVEQTRYEAKHRDIVICANSVASTILLPAATREELGSEIYVYNLGITAPTITWKPGLSYPESYWARATYPGGPPSIALPGSLVLYIAVDLDLWLPF
jgi:hypothetical protein